MRLCVSSINLKENGFHTHIRKLPIKLKIGRTPSSQIEPGSRVAMLLPNGVDAVCFDQAAMANGLIPVPLHAIDTPASSAYILQDSGASYLITNKLEKWHQIKQAGFDSLLKRILLRQKMMFNCSENGWAAPPEKKSFLRSQPNMISLVSCIRPALLESPKA